MKEQVELKSSVKLRERSNDSFYKEVMLWLLLSFTVAAFGTYFIGPLIPRSLMMPLYLVLLVSMIASSFFRTTAKGSGIIAIFYSLGLGVILYPTLNYYFSTGSGNIVVMALAGTAVVFGSAALIGWRSPKSLSSWRGKIAVMILGIIAISLLNTFFFHLQFLYLLIAWGALVLFTIYAFIDIQNIRDKSGDMPPSWYALNVFLDIYNIFVSLLQIFGWDSRR